MRWRLRLHGRGNWGHGKGIWECCAAFLAEGPRKGENFFSAVDDIMGSCGRFVNCRFLGALLAHNCHNRHHESRRKNTHPFLRTAPIIPAFPPLEYTQGGDDKPDDSYCKLAITESTGLLASPVQMRQRQRMGRGGVAVSAGGNRQGDESPLQRDLHVRCMLSNCL